MKKLILLSAIASGTLFYASKAQAQISIQVGLNIPVHRVYTPRPVVVEEAPVYDDENIPADYSDDYYYLPEVEAYYSVPNHCYYYNNGSAWVSAVYLPGAYRNYNWRTAVRYEVRSPRPYLHHDIYRSRWGGYAGDRSNWGRRFERRYNGGGYAYSSRDNRGWGNYNRDRGNWGRGNDNRSWNNDNRNKGNWDRDNRNRGNWDRGNDNRDRGNWGNRSNDNRDRGNWNRSNSNNNHDRGNNNNERFAQNRAGYGTRQ